MAPAMVTGTRSEAPVAAEPERKAAPSPAARALPDTVLWMQKAAGNAAVARTVAARRRPRSSAAARAAGARRAALATEDELLEDEKFGAGLLRSAVARRSA